MPRRKRKRNLEEQWAHERAVWKAQDRAWAKESKKYERMFSSPTTKARKRRISHSKRRQQTALVPYDKLPPAVNVPNPPLDASSLIFAVMIMVGIILMFFGGTYVLIGAAMIFVSPVLLIIVGLLLPRRYEPPIEREHAEDAVIPDQFMQLEPAHTLSPAEFENEVALVLEQIYPVKAKRTGGMGDGGIDIELYDLETHTRRVIVQCKRYLPNRAVPPSEVRDLDSCRRRTGVRQALLVTTGRFSEQTQRDAKSWGIDLMDGTKFEEARTSAYRKLYPPTPPPALPTPTDPIQQQLEDRHERLGL
ncbi:MAG: restriction endonuclease [Anaerolineae bacterium]|nr:restriction endonuclease [Anaerolineae bacterium]